MNRASNSKIRRWLASELLNKYSKFANGNVLSGVLNQNSGSLEILLFSDWACGQLAEVTEMLVRVTLEGTSMSISSAPDCRTI